MPPAALPATADEGTRPGLSRERILDAAVLLLSATPPRPFSMRRLAEALDVTPMALYRWFPGRESLLDALTERLVVTTQVAHDVEGPWLARATRYANAVRQNLLGFLPLLRLEGASRRLTRAVVRSADHGLALMLELGYRGADAVAAYRVLFWTVLDFCVVVDATDALPASGGSGDAIQRIVESEGDELAVRMPTLAGLLAHFTAVAPDALFERTVRTVLLGLLADAPTGNGNDDT